MNTSVDAYFTEGCGRCPLGGTPQCKVHLWPTEMEQLRRIVLDCGLTEEAKWGVPCYTFRGKNIAIVSAFTEFCALSFFKGSLLGDPSGILIKPGKNSRASRYAKFTRLEEIIAQEALLKAYVYEAIEVEKAGLKVEFQPNPEPVPEELQQKLDEDPLFQAAFEALTPGRQRGYILYFSAPKQAKTRSARVEKYLSKILDGKGLHDR